MGDGSAVGAVVGVIDILEAGIAFSDYVGWNIDGIPTMAGYSGPCSSGGRRGSSLSFV